MTELLDAALAYAARGWRVLPLHSPMSGSCSCGRGDECPSPAKHPRWHADDLANGLKDATADAAQIRRWWARWPTANIGVTTGAASGLVVLDVDPDHGGEDTLHQLEGEHGELPTSARALTGGAGWHYLFVHPGVEVRNNASTKLGSGLDIRGDGGYIVAAPSEHISGTKYSWLALGDELPVLPGWLLERIKKADPVPRAPLPPRLPRAPGDGPNSPYGLKALDAEVDSLAHAPEGQRNNTLLRAAQNLFELANGGELEEILVVRELTFAARTAGLGELEIEKTLESAGRRVASNARVAPPRPERGAVREVPNEPPEPPPPEGDEEPPPDFDPTGRFEDTDLGNAKRLVDAHGADLRYCEQLDWWYLWDEKRWRRDTTGEIHRIAHRIAEAILTEASVEPDDAKRKRRERWAYESQSRGRLAAMIAEARWLSGIAVEPGDLDADPWVLNVANGTLDLRTGKLRPHRREDLITKLAPVDYDPAASHPVWDRFLETATRGDFDLAAFLQRAVGYSVTGDCGEEVLFFVHGPTAAGKSTFMDAIEATLGEYARRSDFETFLARNQVGGPRGDIARLAGARFVDSIEVDEGKKLAEGLVKTITGGDVITAAYKYKDEFEYRPQFKLWLAANHAPQVKHGDTAMWRRILRVPFDNTIPETERDPKVKQTLRDPADAGPAILAWAVHGCLLWQHEGLATPEVVTRATEEYRADQDPLREFLEDECTFSAAQFVPSKELRRAYEMWCDDNGQRYTVSPKHFKELLEEHGAHSGKRRLAGKQVRTWEGIGLVSPADLGAGLTRVRGGDPDDIRQPQFGDDEIL